MGNLHMDTMNFAAYGALAAVGVVMFLALLLICKKRGNGRLLPFWIGCGTFLLFALVLESLFHQLVLGSPIGPTIFNGTWTYALYGGLAAGIFEETGRLVAMLWLRKKNCGPNTDLVYGAGHGGVEVLLVLTLTMVQYISYGVMINSGSIGQLLEPLDEAGQATAAALMQQITAPVTWVSLLTVFERFTALVVHVGLSVLVWKAVTVPGKLWLYPAAIALHAVTDFALALLVKLGVSIVIAEAAAAACAVLIFLIARKTRRIEA